jgi:hypothetical protein
MSSIQPDPVDVRAQSGLICAPRPMIAEDFSLSTVHRSGGHVRASAMDNNHTK